MMKRLYALFAIVILSVQPTYAMHIMEGYLPLHWCIIWFVVSIPFVVYSFFKVAKLVKKDRKNKLKIAFSAAFVFILSAMKLPSVQGSSSHLTGTTLGTTLIGPWAMPLAGFIVLLFQALLLGHGGLSTLGANIFSLSIVGPFVAWFLYKGLGKLGSSQWWFNIVIFIATFCGSMSTYVTTSFQLAAAHNAVTQASSAGLVSIVNTQQAIETGIVPLAMKFLSIYAVSQVPLSILEGIMTVIILNLLSRNGIVILGDFRKKKTSNL